MTDEIITNEEVVETTPTEAVEVVADAVVATPEKRRFQAGNRNGQRGGNNARRGRGREERAKPEFDQKVVAMRRVTRVVAGGRRMSFSVALVAGNRKGKVGVGTGKAVDTALAIEKAFRNAKRAMISVPLTKNNSIPHDVQKKFSASEIVIMPARGRGLVAGGAVRTVLELAGVTDVSAKILSRSKNGLNNARVTLKALEDLHTRRQSR